MRQRLLNLLESATGAVIEALEARRLMSVSMEGSVLVIRGNDGNDDVSIVVGHGTRFDSNGQPDPSWQLEIAETGTGWRPYDHTQITGIVVDLGKGNDRAYVSDVYGDMDIPVTMLGGDGRDVLAGGAEDDVIDGGAGADTIDGGGGNDVITDDGATLDPTLLIDRNDAVLGTITLDHDGILKVVLTGRRDDDVLVGTLSAGKMRVTVDYVTRVYDTAAVRGISIDGGAGDDSIVMYNNEVGVLTVPTTLIGGAGNDELGAQGDRDWVDHQIAFRGGGPYAPVTLIGGDGDDVLGAGIGDAYMDGGAGSDRFYKGWGTNTIVDEPDVTPDTNNVDPGPAPSEDAAITPVIAPEPEPTGALDLAVAPPVNLTTATMTQPAGVDAAVLEKNQYDVWSA